MFADDVVILAKNTEQQQSLDALLKYCDKWALSVNIDKITKFGRGKIGTFKYNSQPIAVSDHYQYLGIILPSTRLCYSKAIHKLCDQAKRGAFSMVRNL